MRVNIQSSILLAALLSIATPASSLVPPSGEDDAGGDPMTVDLDWDAPSGAAYLYKVYRDDDLIATTAETHYQDTLAPDPMTGHVLAHYRITAQESDPGGQMAAQSGEESIQEFLVVGTSIPPICSILIISSHLDEIPPVWFAIGYSCLPGSGGPSSGPSGDPPPGPVDDAQGRLFHNNP